MGQIKYTECERHPGYDQFKTKSAAYRRLNKLVIKANLHGGYRPDYAYKCEDKGGLKGCGYFHLGSRPRKKARRTREQLIAQGIIKPTAEEVKS
jgi:hypothetical protein